MRRISESDRTSNSNWLCTDLYHHDSYTLGIDLGRCFLLKKSPRVILDALQSASKLYPLFIIYFHK